MEYCKKHFLLIICVLQLICTIERQIFDFLGYMWAPILMNFFGIIFIIFGFFGAFQYRTNYIITYLIWHLLWIAWNIFIICFYLDIGILNKDSDILNLGTGSASWWEVNGYGCKPYYPTNITDEDIFRPVRPEKVIGCFLEYQYVEVIHAAIQCVFGVLGCIVSICLSRSFMKEDNTSQGTLIRKPSKRPSLYSIEFTSQRYDTDNIDCDVITRLPSSASPKPMTPRRVKRRSVMVRGTSSRHSTASRRSHASHRSSKRHAQSPVTRLMQQQSPSTTDTSPDWRLNGHLNPTYQQSSMQSLNDHQHLDELYSNRPPSARSSYSNFHGTRPISYISEQYYANQATPQVPLKRVNGIPKNTIKHTTFFNNGPPAYSIQSHNRPDSETTI